MREIKFRAWDKMNKVFAYFNVAEEFALGDDILMQFTGLKDKNGKEIYEGDICKVILNVGFRNIENVGVMRWNENAAQFAIETEVEDFIIPREHVPEQPEVIGNIYENPELLPTKQS